MPEPDGPPVMDDDDLGELLRRQAGLHRPDPERVMARVQQARAQQARVQRARLQRARGQAAAGREPVPVPEWGRPRLLAVVAGAAAVAATLVLSVTSLRPNNWDGPDTVPEATVSMAGSSDRSSGDGGAPPLPSTAPTGSTTPGSAGHIPSPGPPRRSRTPGASPVGTSSLQVSAAGVATSVTLPGAGEQDWVVVGARRDGRQVRAKRGNGAVTRVAAEGAAAAVVDGPLEVSWSGGSPEEDHAGARTWWTVPAGLGRFRIVVRLSGPTTVRLRLGTSGVSASARPTLTAQVTGTPHPGSASVPVNAAVSEALVRVPDGTTGGTLTLTFSSRHDVGILGLAAVSVS
jgi:hypothetical protein